jgi:hypothetical protein
MQVASGGAVQPQVVHLKFGGRIIYLWRALLPRALLAAISCPDIKIMSLQNIYII